MQLNYKMTMHNCAEVLVLVDTIMQYALANGDWK